MKWVAQSRTLFAPVRLSEHILSPQKALKSSYFTEVHYNMCIFSHFTDLRIPFYSDWPFLFSAGGMNQRLRLSIACIL